MYYINFGDKVLPDPGSGVVGGSGVMIFHAGVVLTVVLLLRLLLLQL